jgi:two-component system, OmpR family, phosphate regulon sensor histidine kinase PhoR
MVYMAQAPQKQSKSAKKAAWEHAETDALFFSIGEGAVVTDERGYISRINQTGLEILGFTADELLGKWYPEAVIAETMQGQPIPNMERPITEVFIAGKPIFKKVFYRRKDGSRVPIALTVSPIMVKGEPVGAIEVFRDITEEQELENAKDEFISIASHQLRTPATVVKQHVGMMLEGYFGDLPTEHRSILQTAYDYNNQQLTIINDLLKVAQLDANKIKMVRKKIDIIKLVEDVAESQDPEYAKKGMKIVLKSPKEPLFSRVDPLHIRMVTENLLDNARKYSPDNSKVTIHIKDTDGDIHIDVKDEGIGIDKKDLPRLFQKFSRVSNPHSNISGTGLGLYWAYKLIQMHNGNISVSSRFGRGTTFKVVLPKGLPS